MSVGIIIFRAASTLVTLITHFVRGNATLFGSELGVFCPRMSVGSGEPSDGSRVGRVSHSEGGGARCGVRFERGGAGLR